MCALPSQPSAPKRKEIYKYEAPWCVYSMNWGIRPDKRFRLALGSFVEEYNNKVQIQLLNFMSVTFLKDVYYQVKSATSAKSISMFFKFVIVVFQCIYSLKHTGAK